MEARRPSAWPASDHPPLQQILQSRTGNGLDESPQQEPVGKSSQSRILGKRIGGSYADAQRDVANSVAAAEDSLIQQTEEGVQNGAGAKKDFVEEGDLGLWQHLCRLGLDDSLTKPSEVYGAENLARLREAAKKVLEIDPAYGPRDPPNRLTLGGARWPDDEQMLPGHRRQRDRIHQRLSLDQPSARICESCP